MPQIFFISFRAGKISNIHSENAFPTARKIRATDESHPAEPTEHKSEAGHEEILFSEVEAAGLIFHYTLLYALNEHLLIGVEFLSFYDVGGHFSYVAVFPQIQILSSVVLQVGPGVIITKDEIIPKFAHRLGLESKPSEETFGPPNTK